jgi:hypothetical protein
MEDIAGALVALAQLGAEQDPIPKPQPRQMILDAVDVVIAQLASHHREEFGPTLGDELIGVRIGELSQPLDRPEERSQQFDRPTQHVVGITREGAEVMFRPHVDRFYGEPI